MSDFFLQKISTQASKSRSAKQRDASIYKSSTKSQEKESKVKKYLTVIGAFFAIVSPVLAGQDLLRSEIELLNASEQGVVVLLSFTNTSDQDMFVIDYETALTRLERDLFRVELEGEIIPYTGVMVMRVGPLTENWARIGPGETVSAKVSLAEDYDLSRAGEYSIAFEAPAFVLVGLEEGQLPVADPWTEKSAALNMSPIWVSSDKISFGFQGVTESIVRDALAIDQPLFSKESYHGLNSSQIAAIETAKACARTNVCCAGTYCNSWVCPTSWYQTWFHCCTYRYSVCGNFSDACNVLGNNNFTFYYNGSYCSSGIIAYVWKDRPYEIWICPDFFSYTHLQCHTIAHEVFHWNIVAGADDYGYGESYCRNNSCYHAANNADNYAYAADYCPDDPPPEPPPECTNGDWKTENTEFCCGMYEQQIERYECLNERWVLREFDCIPDPTCDLM